VDLQAKFAVDYPRFTAIHYEESREASKWGWPIKNTRHYLTIHHLDRDGQAAFETFHLGGEDVAWVVDALQKETGLQIDHTLPKRSFLGIPIRAAIGDHVVVTDKMGNAVAGTITELSPSTLAVAGYAFDSTNVHSIKRTRSRGRDALRWFAIGAITGGPVGALAGYVLGGAAGAFQVGAILGAYSGGVGAGSSAIMPSYNQRARRDIYLSDGASTAVGSSPAP
jgi:outer membrane lipoprotein SlyB